MIPGIVRFRFSYCWLRGFSSGDIEAGIIRIKIDISGFINSIRSVVALSGTVIYGSGRVMRFLINF